MKKITLTFIFVISLLFFGGSAHAATLSLSPGSGSYAVGQIFSVNILLNTQGKAVDGVDIRYLNYNPSYLEVQDENGSTTGVQIAPGTLMPMTLANSVDANSGRITFSQITAGGTTFTNNTPQTLATVRFKVLQTVNSSVTFSFINGGTTDCNVASVGVDVLSSVTNGNYGFDSQPPPPSLPSLSPSPSPTPSLSPTPTPISTLTPTPSPSRSPAPTPKPSVSPVSSPKPSLSAPAPSLSFSPSPSPKLQNTPHASPSQPSTAETRGSFINYLIIAAIVIVIAAIIFIRIKKSNKI